MNNTTTRISMNKATEDRRNAATLAFKERAHAAWHRAHGADAPCHMCGNIAKGETGFAL